jgi:hypothetical protein
MTEGEGEGIEVRCGFCRRAAWRGARDDGGVTNVISIKVSLSSPRDQLKGVPVIPILLQKSIV